MENKNIGISILKKLNLLLHIDRNYSMYSGFYYVSDRSQHKSRKLGVTFTYVAASVFAGFIIGKRMGKRKFLPGPGRGPSVLCRTLSDLPSPGSKPGTDERRAHHRNASVRSRRNPGRSPGIIFYRRQRALSPCRYLPYFLRNSLHIPDLFPLLFICQKPLLFF